MFNIGKMKMTKWSKKASKEGLPQQWQTMPTKVINILFDPYCKDIMLLQSHDMFVLLDTTKVRLFVVSHLRHYSTLGLKKVSVVLYLLFSSSISAVTVKKYKIVRNKTRQI